MFLKLKDLPDFEIIKGYRAKMVHVENMSIAHLQIDAGHEIPLHQHPHEQVTNVLSGELEMTVDGETRICKAGDVVMIPSNVLHSAKSITDCWVIDVFQPVREEYRV